MHPANPLVLASLSFLTFVLTIGFTTPASKARHVALVLMAGYMTAIFVAPNQRDWFNHQIFPNIAGGSTFGVMLHYIDIAFVQAWSYRMQGPTGSYRQLYANNKKKEAKKQKPSGTLHDRFKFGLELLFNKRFAGTPWQAKNVPPFDKQRPGWVPSRAQFLVKNFIGSVICILLLDVIGLAGRDTSQNHALFDEHFVPILTRLSEVSVQEVVIRIMTSAITAISTYLFFQAVYSGSAVVMVGLGLNEVASWRPLFGDFTEITSLRRTWR